MKEFIGKNCKITLFLNNKTLFYTAAPVLSVSETHICFKDKYGEQYSFRLQDIVEIRELRLRSGCDLNEKKVYG